MGIDRSPFSTTGSSSRGSGGSAPRGTDIDERLSRPLARPVLVIASHPFAFLAVAGVAHYNPAKLNLDQAQALAYRAIETTCSTAAFGVSLPAQLGIVSKEGARILEDAELDSVKESVNLWKEKEVEAIGALAVEDSPPTLDADHPVQGIEPPETA